MNLRPKGSLRRFAGRVAATSSSQNAGVAQFTKVALEERAGDFDRTDEQYELRKAATPR